LRHPRSITHVLGCDITEHDWPSPRA
jgi:hypothetical protein